LRHFCPFPPKLVERILLLTTNKNQVVLDVFGGSGIVLGIAKVMGRKFIGFDINEHYIKNFHNKVLPQIEKNWEERRIELNLLVKQRSKKKDEIKKLRQVKYPKTLLNEILKLRNERTLENFPLYTIFSISKYLNEMKQDIFLVFDGEINFEKLNKDVKTIIKKPPLSKFGINVNVSAFKKDDFIQKNKNNTLFNGSSLYLYTNGITNIPKKSINFSNWVNNFKEDWLNQRYPPIISNIKVNIRVKNKK